MAGDIKGRPGVWIAGFSCEDILVRSILGAIPHSFHLREIAGNTHEKTKELGFIVLVANQTSLVNGRRVVITGANFREADITPIGSSIKHINIDSCHLLGQVVTEEKVHPGGPRSQVKVKLN